MTQLDADAPTVQIPLGGDIGRQRDAADAPDAGHNALPVSSVVALGAASALVSACGGGDGSADSGLPFVDTAGYLHPTATNDADAARFLQQATFSSTSSEIADLRSGGYGNWLARQYGSFPGPTAWDWLETQGYGDSSNTQNYFGRIEQADYMVWNQIMTGPDAMRRRIALALSEFFVVSSNSMNFNWRSHAMAHYWDTLVRHAFGNFRQLLKDVTLHPAMGYFLNTKGNLKEDTRRGRVPDENYGREVMQLFSIGLYALNLDGSVKTSGGQRIETYTQDDVSNIARVFTGYDFDTSDGVRIPVSTYTIESKDFARKPMSFDASKHSMLEATFLGTTIPAGTPGPQALEMALDTLFNHPNVGPFFARQMIQRLVTSEPSPGYVARVATKFNNNGFGVRGDLGAVWAAILLDDEARGPQSLSDTGFGKLREPMLRLAQWARTFGASSAAGTWKVRDLSSADSRLGQSPLRSPSVFNFFRPGYVPPGTQLSASDATAPEFQLVSEISVGGYLNYMQGVIRNGVDSDMKAGYLGELALVADPVALVSHLSLVMCADQLSAATKTTMASALDTMSISSDSRKLDRIAAAVLMVMASPEYLIQK